jgi:hypothetical protein
MSQFGRPIADTLIDNWQTQAGGVTNIYQQIDEVVADEADFARTQLFPTSDVLVVKLTVLEDPVSSINHFIRYHYGKDLAGGAQIDQTVELRQGYVNEGSPGTLIAQWIHTDVGVMPQSVVQTLSGPQADSITDYSDLYLRFVGNQV